MPEYPIGRTVFGSVASITAAYERFREQPIDEMRLAATRKDPLVPFVVRSPARRG